MRTLQENHDVSKSKLVAQNLENARIDIAGIQECRERGFGNYVEGNYEFHYSGYKKFPGGMAQSGVMIAIRKSPMIEIKGIEHVSHRLITADLVIQGIKIKVIVAYAPTDRGDSDKTKAESVKNTFWTALNKEVRKVEKSRKENKQQKLMILGDFNSTSSAITHHATNFHGQEIPGIVNNDNGHRLTRFLAENKLNVASTFFTHKPVNNYTWYSNDGVTKKIIDLCLNDKFLQKHCLDSRVRRSYDFHSDHRMVVTRFRVPKKRIFKKKANKAERKPKYDFGAVNDKHHSDFISKLDDGSFDSAKNIVTSLKSAAECLPVVRGNKNVSYPWDNDEELTNLWNERKKLHISQNKTEYRKISRKIRKRVNHLRNEHYLEEALKFTEAHIRKEIEKAYTIAKQQATTRRKKARDIECPGLFEYFKNHFTKPSDKPTPTILQQPRPLPKISVEFNSGPPDSEEIIKIIKKCKAKKASIDIPAEVLKLALESEKFVDELTDFYQKMWTDNEVPDLFGESEISAIWKNKGSYTQPKYWRGIMLSSILTKILTVLIIDRIAEAYNINIGEGQMGFRQGRGCRDGSYCLKRVHQYCRKTQRELFCSMVDLSSAFDWCRREWVFESMRHVVGESQLIDLLENMYGKTTAYLRGKVDQVFKSTCGVRQGGPESPVAYNCLAQMAMDTFEARCKLEGLDDFEVPFKIPKNASNTGKTVSGNSILNWLGYADDLCIFAFDLETLKRKTEILWDVFLEFDLAMNLDKTETLIYNWKNGSVPVRTWKVENIPSTLYPDTLFNINDFPIKNSENFKYLGGFSQVDDSSIGDVEIENRITAGVCKFYELKNFFYNRKIYLQTRIQFLNSLVRTRMCYLCETWAISKAQVEKIQSNMVQFIRGMIKGGNQRLAPEQYTRKNGTTGEFSKYRFSNEEIMKIAKVDHIENYIIKQQTNWIAHCVRADDSSYIKQLTFTDPPKGNLKRGVMPTTYRSVLQDFKSRNKTENQMIAEFKSKQTCEVQRASTSIDSVHTLSED